MVDAWISKKKMWWIRNIFHIETVFIITAVFICAYILWKKKTGKSIYQTDLYIDKFTKSLHMAHPKPVQPKRINKNEERCRDIFENIFKVKFKSVRPDWLQNPVTKKNLELDGFNPDIKTPLGKGLAFEYDGEQHSKFNKHFHRNGPDEFEYQIKKDSWKDDRCRKNKILLIRIPYYILPHDLERYIKEKLKNNGVEGPPSIMSNSVPKPPLNMNGIKHR